MAPEEVQEVAQDEEVGASQSKRERSTILFPYQDLADAITVAQGVRTVGGSACQIDQLAAQLGHTVTSGSFQQRLNTARIFGLLTNSKGMVTLTPLGTRIVDPQQDKAAKVEAFLNVPLYKKVYEHFKGTLLPPPGGLENTIVGFGVSAKQKDTARRAFHRSATLAGFFEIAQDRLTLPSLRGEVTSIPLGDNSTSEDVRPKSGNGGNGGDGPHHPLIDGLIKALPKSGDPWALESRRKWLQAAAMNFDYVYTLLADDQRSLKVTLEGDSAAKDSAK